MQFEHWYYEHTSLTKEMKGSSSILTYKQRIFTTGSKTCDQNVKYPIHFDKF